MHTVHTEDGKLMHIETANILYIEEVPGEPDEPPTPAQDEVPDDPGEEANLQLGLTGRPPKKGKPAQEAKPGKLGTPGKSIIHFVGGDTLTVAGQVRHIV